MPPPTDPTAVMSDKGYYNQHSRTQALAMSCAFPFLENAAARISLPQDGRVFHVADLGSSQGRNSLEPLKRVLRILKTRQERPFPIAITHNDQAANDFSALFLLLQNDPESYLREFHDVYPYASGRSFYERLFPDSSVDLFWSSIALHWLRRAPVTLRDHFYLNASTGAPREAFARQAQEDWKDFLLLRARELKPGGRMVLVAGATNEKKELGGEAFLDLANRVLQEMTATHRISPEEYEAFTFSAYHRTREEFLAPFQAEPFSRLFHVEEDRLDDVPDAQCRQFQEDGNASLFAENLGGFLRAFTEPLLRGILGAQRRTEEIETVLKEFYETFQKRVLKNPSAVQFSWRLASLHLVRT